MTHSHGQAPSFSQSSVQSSVQPSVQSSAQLRTQPPAESSTQPSGRPSGQPSGQFGAPHPGPPRWDVPALFPQPESAEVEELLEASLTAAQQIADAYAGRLAGLAADALREAIGRYDRCIAQIQEASCYAELLQTHPPLRRQATALLSRCDRTWAELASVLAFFETELGAWLPATHGIQDSPKTEDSLKTEGRPKTDDGPKSDDGPDGLGPYGNFAAKVRAGRAQQLPDGREEILARLLPTGGEGWERLAQQLLAGISVDLGGAPRGIGEVLPDLYAADRDTRARAHAAVSRALAGQVELRALALSMAVTDRETRAGLRGVNWLHEARITDQVGSAELTALLAAADQCVPLMHSYYALKRELLDLDDFTDYDRYAPVGSLRTEIPWSAALDTALAVMESISPVFAELSRTVAKSGRIDAEPRPGKRQSAYTKAIPGQLPCISMNFTGKPRDLLKLVHELGHAVYLQLAAEQPYLAATPTPVMAETVALFCEGAAVRWLLAENTGATTSATHAENAESAGSSGDAARAGDSGRTGDSGRAVRQAWLARWLEDQMVAIGRHAALHRFEQALHDRARSGDVLDAEHIGELWLAGQGELYGPAVRLTDGYRLWWSYLDPLFTAPGSNYPYVYGQLSALTLLRCREADPLRFGARLVATLRLGDSRPPAELLALLTQRPGPVWQDAVAELAGSLDDLRSLIDFRAPHPAGSGKSTS